LLKQKEKVFKAVRSIQDNKDKNTTDFVKRNEVTYLKYQKKKMKWNSIPNKTLISKTKEK
jgi:hypothetical protein